MKILTDNYHRLKRFSHYAQKAGLILIRQGPGVLVQTVSNYLKIINKAGKIQKYYSFSSEPVEGGINVVGALYSGISLGESVRTLIKAIKTTNIKHSLINYKLYSLDDDDKKLEKEFYGKNPHNVNVVVIDPNSLHLAIPSLGKNFFKNRYTIGYWAWELPDLPERWKSYEKYFDEFWAPSEFVKKAIAKTINKPVTIVPHSIEINNFKKYGRDHFGLDADKFLLSYVFDYSSVSERKNPLAAVRAFREAFPGNNGVSLVIKCSNIEIYRQQHDLLLKEIHEDKRIKVIDKRLTADEIYSLFDVSDAYVSLHRAEGFGLTMAEAMLLGKPVICTNYSGNTDFTKEDNSFLVGYKIIQLEEDLGPFKKGDKWAEPDIYQAAEFMRKLYENKELRSETGNRARKFIQDNFNPALIGGIIEKRLEQINQSGKP